MDTQQWGRSHHPTPAMGMRGYWCQWVRMRQVQGQVGMSLRSMHMAGEQHPCSPAQAGTHNSRLSLNGLVGPGPGWRSQVGLPRPFNTPRVVGGQTRGEALCLTC